MLQRIQSIYLLLVFFLSLLMLTGPIAFIEVEGGGLFLKNSGVYDLEGMKLGIATWPLMTMIIISAVLSFFTIFSYLKRPRQMRLTLFQMFFNLGLIAMAAYYVWFVMEKYDGLRFVFQWRIVIPPIMLILLILAYRGIRKDELLVKAAERLR